MSPVEGKTVRYCWVCDEKTRHTIMKSVIVHESPYDFRQTTTVFVRTIICDKCGTSTKE